MRVYLVIDETCFYHPDFVARLIEKTQDEIVGAALVTKILPKNNTTLYLVKHWRYLTLLEMWKLTVRYVIAKLCDIFLPKKRNGKFYSVSSVLRFFNVDFIEVHYDINKAAYTDHIKSKRPDVLISSNSLYFGEDVLNAPKISCLNRHSALLPSYGGLFTVLQACAHGEEFTGASVHIMGKQMDTGGVLSQRKVAITPKDTIAGLYERCFELSVDVVLEALDKVRKSDFSPVQNDYKPSYYSFPAKEHWQAFRKRGGRFA